MRIKSIKLTWFRGAADTISLDTTVKSMVVYGENGSGKSSFVDAVEFILNNGKIGHLSHEYSGRHQEKGIINTKTPKNRKTELRIEFEDGSELTTEIKRTGTFKSSGAETAAMATWDYRRTVLRQDEVAAFIASTKGVKYSALLPLLGLSRMEIAAENLHRLAKTIEQQYSVKSIRDRLKELEAKRDKAFLSLTDDQILDRIQTIHATYCRNSLTTDPVARCDETRQSIHDRISAFSDDQKKHLILKEVASLDFKDQLAEVRSANSRIAGGAEPHLRERLEVIQSALPFAAKLGEEKQVDCPACGQSITVELFSAHLKDESIRLKAMIDAINSRKQGIGALCDRLKLMKSYLDRSEIRPWLDSSASAELGKSLQYIEKVNFDRMRAECTEDDLKLAEELLLPITAAAARASRDAPPEMDQLSTDLKTVEVAREVIEGIGLASLAERADGLVSFIELVEEGVREEIRQRSETIIKEISADIQRMWVTLHPGEAIEDVELYVPADTDKAIDIKLKFHGVEQDSPRLTLSEGYRNSLGLSIFLAMAKREEHSDRPLFLDDVVVSLDRNHRGLIADLLQKEFGGRQVFIFTHDREWYTELRRQLDASNWVFKALMPFEQPDIGIRWSAKTWTFDDARALLKDHPDSAGNTARKIMDLNLALLAERLKLRLPYLHLDRNDHRVASEFMLRLISDGQKCFQRKGAKDYEPHKEAIEALRRVDKLLGSWGNRASHSFDVVRPEAEKLIAECETALELFDCPNCKKAVYRLPDETAEILQCSCGNLRWRYGKA
jgi:DNA repair exonuclease SbcCD ATPase subunit